MNQIRVMLVEDHRILAEGIKMLLSSAAHIYMAAEVQDSETALEWLSNNSCDVLLLDISLPGHDGLWLLEQLKARKRSVPTLVLTMHKASDVILKAMDLGAAGYLVKSATADELTRAIAAVAEGSSYGDRYVREAVSTKLKGAPMAPLLSPRESEILVLLAQGVSNLELADRLGVSKSTIKTYVRSLYDKIGVNDRTQATLYAVRNGYTTMPE